MAKKINPVIKILIGITIIALIGNVLGIFSFGFLFSESTSTLIETDELGVVKVTVREPRISFVLFEQTEAFVGEGVFIRDTINLLNPDLGCTVDFWEIIVITPTREVSLGDLADTAINSGICDPEVEVAFASSAPGDYMVRSRFILTGESNVINRQGTNTLTLIERDGGETCEWETGQTAILGGHIRIEEYKDLDLSDNTECNRPTRYYTFCDSNFEVDGMSGVGSKEGINTCLPIQTDNGGSQDTCWVIGRTFPIFGEKVCKEASNLGAGTCDVSDGKYPTESQCNSALNGDDGSDDGSTGGNGDDKAKTLKISEYYSISDEDLVDGDYGCVSNSDCKPINDYDVLCVKSDYDVQERIEGGFTEKCEDSFGGVIGFGLNSGSKLIFGTSLCEISGSVNSFINQQIGGEPGICIAKSKSTFGKLWETILTAIAATGIPSQWIFLSAIMSLILLGILLFSMLTK